MNVKETVNILYIFFIFCLLVCFFLVAPVKLENNKPVYVIVCCTLRRLFSSIVEMLLLRKSCFSKVKTENDVVYNKKTNKHKPLQAKYVTPKPFMKRSNIRKRLCTKG